MKKCVSEMVVASNTFAFVATRDCMVSEAVTGLSTCCARFREPADLEQAVLIEDEEAIEDQKRRVSLSVS